MPEQNYDELKQEIIRLSTEFREHVLSGNKDYLRQLHINSKRAISNDKLQKLRSQFSKYESYFAQPSRIDINKIQPVMINVESGKLWQNLFTLIRHSWSMPFSKGYGRRLRYIIFDQHHNSVIGIVGLQSPPADLACRDNLFNYPEKRKLELINQTLDIYTLGAVPPYAGILGGKLVAGLAASNIVQNDYAQKYADRTTLIDESVLDSRLVALTTTSAFGRSSIYNRLKFEKKWIAKSIGYTAGSGNIHLETIYPELVEVLKQHEQFHGGGYGKGPRQRWQNLSRAFKILGLPNKYKDHGLRREVFLYPLVTHLANGMAGKDFGENSSLDPDEYSEYWKFRWAKPRAERNHLWLELDTTEYFMNALK